MITKIYPFNMPETCPDICFGEYNQFLVSNQGMKTGWRGVNDRPAPRWTVLKLQKNSKSSHHPSGLACLCQYDCVCQSHTHECLHLFMSDCRQPSLDEALLWARSFEMMLRSREGREVFREFLRSEYSEDNLLFWMACEELKKETDPLVVEEKSRIIYEDYVSILSPKEVSLDSRVREGINQNLAEPSNLMYEEAQFQIYNLMHRDSFPRFLNSSVYRDFLTINAGQ
uniref:Regulator of G protein signaling 17 n=1 Tax=Sander lucioperca TaxID=283035 RepID=A0A8C9Y0T9_SANLU